MNTLIILFNQTRNGAIVEIFSLLIIAAIIGYTTAWLYYKSVYTHKKKALKFEIENLKSQIVIQSIDIRNLEKSILSKDTEPISEIIDISPNSIKRDNWIAQAIKMTTKQSKIVIGYI